MNIYADSTAFALRLIILQRLAILRRQLLKIY